MGLSLFRFSWWAPKNTTECVMAVDLAPIESAYTLSIGAKINDLGWPWTAITQPITNIWIKIDPYYQRKKTYPLGCGIQTWRSPSFPIVELESSTHCIHVINIHDIYDAWALAPSNIGEVDFQLKLKVSNTANLKWIGFLPRDARSTKRGIAIVSRPSVCLSICL